ncbi:hypothetical protein AS034_05365 [[Bacillus] enclensis]|uniref:HNH endonuclease n=1 Tax=[Bacillus] enclensis TaxID=1402860 RepID=A0A0V8HM82_9BACI|nr:HNH endonuclease [[Bacillus] enclensis]KSU63677.1 hypothetical protein AS034_05365 [[Bacillus] enclensis]SCB87922.1 HNH endonuclease [[Bacillus] enclensis]
MIYFEKSLPAPPSLEIEKHKNNGTYLKADVISQLKQDFKNKCYICENKALISINVEHLVSHREDIDKKFSWENLFLSCSHCNNIKLHHYDNILNCTMVEDDIENSIKLKVDPYPKSSVEVTALKNDERVEKTVELLNKVYNGTTILKTEEAETIKKNLLKEILAFQSLLFEYDELEHDHEDDLEEINNIKKQISRHLRNSSAYTGFKRWIIKANESLTIEFGSLFLEQESDTKTI